MIASLLSRTGASHAMLALGELGLLHVVLPEAAVAEVRRNLAAKLPEAAPLFEEFLRTVPVQIRRPTPHDRERARALADPKDIPILATAIGAGSASPESRESSAECGATGARAAPCHQRREHST